MKKFTLALLAFLLCIPLLMAQQPKIKQVRTIDSIQAIPMVKSKQAVQLHAPMESLQIQIPQDVVFEKKQKEEPQTIKTDSVRPIKVKPHYDMQIALPYSTEMHNVSNIAIPVQEKIIFQKDTSSKQPQPKK